MVTLFLICFVSLTTCLTAADLGVQESDVDFFFYSASNPSEGINITDPNNIQKTEFSANKDTFFCVHGWLANVTSTSCDSIINSLLEKHDINVIVVDWDRSAGNFIYPVIAAQIEDIGKWVASKIKNLVDKVGLDLGTTRMVGHFLGAHIAGVAGRVLDGRLKFVVGLDPAGLFFTSSDSPDILNRASAQFVQVMHTSGGRAGYYDQLGHADYYPNGGKAQPMCGILDGTCSHFATLDFYAESLRTGNFKAKKCENYIDYENGKCDNAEDSYMGEYDIDTQASGRYYLETNNASPYAKN